MSARGLLKLRPPSALRVRLALSCLLVCGIALVVFGFFLLAQERAVLLDGLDTQLKATVVQALYPVSDATHTGKSQAQRATPAGRVLNMAPAGIVVAVARPDRQGLLRLQNWPVTLRSLTALPIKYQKQYLPIPKGESATSCSTREGWRVCTLLAYDGTGHLVSAGQAAESLAVLDPPLDEMRTWLLLVLPLVLFLVTAGGWLLTGRALAPIDRITRTSGAISAGNLAGRLGPLPRNDEVGRLAATLDTMLDRLEQAFVAQERAIAQQRAFAAAASHELRTPLTIVKSNLDVLRRARALPADADEVLRGVDEELVRLGRLMEDLLTLARAESGQEEAPCDLVALDTLVCAATADMEPLVREKGLSLTTEVAGAVEVVGDPLRLRQLVLNLLGNAVAYTPAGGSIHVRLTGRDGEAALAVADTGVGIGAADLPHIFESFYRADKARSRAAGSSGLGLAIARWCAEAHGGRIAVESQPGRGSTFVVSLPLAQIDDEAGPILPDERERVSR